MSLEWLELGVEEIASPQTNVKQANYDGAK